MNILRIDSFRVDNCWTLEVFLKENFKAIVSSLFPP